MVVLTRLAACALVAVLTAAAPAPAGAQETLERDVKAAFLYNFTKYIAWPPHAFVQDSDPFRICVAADTDFKASVQTLIAGEKMGRRPLEMAIAEPGQIGRCQILYIARGQGARGASLLTEALGRPVLTVVEDDKAFGPGVIIRLDREGSRIRFDIDVSAAGRAGLAVDAKLVRVAREVRQGTP